MTRDGRVLVGEQRHQKLQRSASTHHDTKTSQLHAMSYHRPSIEVARWTPSKSRTKEIHALCRVQDMLLLQVEDEFTLELSTDAQSVSGAHASSRRFEFDSCFPPTCSQSDVYQETHDLIQAAFDGYNVCIFCYGQV